MCFPVAPLNTFPIIFTGSGTNYVTFVELEQMRIPLKGAKMTVMNTKDKCRNGCSQSQSFCVYMVQPWAPPSPFPAMVMVPRLAPSGSGWGGCGWVGMLVDGVVVFANGVRQVA